MGTGLNEITTPPAFQYINRYHTLVETKLNEIGSLMCTGKRHVWILRGLPSYQQCKLDVWIIVLAGRIRCYYRFIFDGRCLL